MFNKASNIQDCVKSIQEQNSESQSNGSLMRTTPLSVYCHKLSDDEIYRFTKMDVNLTHSHKIVVYATTCYNIAIAHLINNFGDSEGAINRVDKYIENLKKADELKHHWSKIMDAKDENELIRADKKIGYIMIAFTYAFFYLKNNFTYQDAIESMLMKGGDTDTNATIVGGLLGARNGLHGIPKKWKQKVINCKNTRPESLQIKSEKDFFNKIDSLIKYAPKSGSKEIINA